MAKDSNSVAWRRLQFISEHRAQDLWRTGAYGYGQYSHKTGRYFGFHVPEEIRENIKALGDDDEAVKSRLAWYHLYLPGVFDKAVEEVH